MASWWWCWYLVLCVKLDQLGKRGKLLSPVQVVEVPCVLDLDVRHLAIMISATSITSMMMNETTLMNEDESDNGVNEVVWPIWRRRPNNTKTNRRTNNTMMKPPYLSSPSDWECEVARIALTRPVMQRGLLPGIMVLIVVFVVVFLGDGGDSALATHLARKLPSLPLSRRRCSASIPWIFGWNQRRLDILNLHFHFS